MIRTTGGWIDVYKEKQALWFHDGNPRRPHALLTTSGNHSNGFFNSEIVMEDAFLLDQACSDLVSLLEKSEVNIDHIDRVVGPAMGAITLAHGLASKISKLRPVADMGRPCLRAYTEKVLNNGVNVMMFKRTSIRPGEVILLVEDVLTTGASVTMSADAVELDGGLALPFLAVLVNRSAHTWVNGKEIISLIHRPMLSWAPEDCPLCKQGSVALRPKPKENWASLNAKY